MHRCLVARDAWSSDCVHITAEESRHLFHVLRARPGTVVGVFDGFGRTAEAVVGAARDVLTLTPGSTVQNTRPIAPVLFLSLLKPARMELAIEKATELGAAVITPVIAERCVARVSPKQLTDKMARWERLVEAAAKQCDTAWLPRVDTPLKVSAVCDLIPGMAWAAVGALNEEGLALGLAVRDAFRCVAPSEDASAQLGIVIGPEGDFTDAEVSQLMAAGARPVSLGPRVLRSETAAIYSLSVITSEIENAHV
jgi:16S rRNA (uracil1498-N3)-methyltransferase